MTYIYWEDFVQDLSGHAELYDPEKHDMDRAGGGSFMKDFESMES